MIIPDDLHMKTQWHLNHAIQEGIFFILLSGVLFWYGIDSYSKSFNKDWSQSPYLFPVLVAVLMALLAISLLCQGIKEKPAAEAGPGAPAHQTGAVLVVLGLSLIYYLALAMLKIPYITIGIFSWSLTISNFEVVTVVFLFAMMFYLGVRKIPVLILVPLGTSLFLSVTFRTMLHVLLP